MTQKQKNFFTIFILGILTALGPFSIDMYLPAFPDIAHDLKTDVARVAISLSSFFIGISAGQLIYGPLLDRFGRKKPLYVGLVIYILTSAGCMMVKDIDSLIALRFLQAIGSCAAGVASVAMVRDFFPVKDSAKVFALLMLVVGASPMIAPTVGGYLTVAFGWQSVFLVLLVIAMVIMAASAFGLPNVHQPDPTVSLKLMPIFKGYLAVFKEPQFYTYTFTGAMSFAGLFAYVAGSPVVFMDVFHLNAKVYGWIFAFLSVSFIGSSQVNSLLLRKFQSEHISFYALLLQSAASFVFLLLCLSQWISLIGLLVMLFIILGCVGFISPNTSALALAPFSKNAGSASALMGALQMGVGSLASLALGFFTVKSTVPLAFIMALSSFLSLVILVLGRRRIVHTVEALEGPEIPLMH